MLSWIVVSKFNPNTKKYFQSSESIRNEVTRHISSDYWFIIHPFSVFRFYWNSMMAFNYYLLFLEIPFTYAFNLDLGMTSYHIWFLSIINGFCLIDIFINFFTGYKKKNSNFIVLHQGSIAQHYAQGLFLPDILSSLPLVAISQLMFQETQVAKVEGFPLIFFHSAFVVDMMRMTSMGRCWRYFHDLADKLKFSYTNTVIIFLIIRSVMFVHWCICVYKAVASSIFFYLYTAEERSEDVNELLDPDRSCAQKYFKLLNFVIWALFDTSFGDDVHDFIPGKFVTSGCMIVGLTYNIYILIQILNIMNTVHSSKTKYYEIMNQLDAYMMKKQFPMSLQQRLKFFYSKKFRKSYYKEDEILRNLSEPLRREIWINTGELFVEKVQIFKNIPKSLVSFIVASLKKEQFLPNDLIIKAGTVGDCMFFIGSGTVVVTTRNGKELCHLDDGDHFGEIALILKNNKRIANVMAIEFCEIYILDFVSFKKYVQVNETIMQKLTETANNRMHLTLEAEELYKKQLHEKIALATDDDKSI
ncbi:unnamed protein product [Diamesa hyperborea]